jgi:cell division protein FtsW (lipid II flippase)
MGGTSIWFTSIAIGIILSVSKEMDEAEEPTKEPTAIENAAG